MSNDLESMEEGFKNLQEYSDEQFKTIVSLKEKLAELESKNKHLLDMLSKNVPSLEYQNMDIIPGVSNERIICETQIALLKESAVSRQLTLEEAKKLQIYVGVLATIKEKKDDGIHADIPMDQLINIAAQDQTNG